MASYTLLIKAAETDSDVTYRFGPSEQRLGLMRFEKTENPAAELLEPVPGEVHQNHFEQAFRRCRALYRRAEPFPDRTSYAS